MEFSVLPIIQLCVTSTAIPKWGRLTCFSLHHPSLKTTCFCASWEKWFRRGTRRWWSSAASITAATICEELEIADPTFLPTKWSTNSPKVFNLLVTLNAARPKKPTTWTLSSISGSHGKQLLQIADQIIVLLSCYYFSNAQFGQKVQKLAKLL